MAQTYEIFTNGFKLILASSEDAGSFPNATLITDDNEDLVHSVEGAEGEQVVLLHRDADELFEIYSERYEIIDAAGGLVKDPSGEVLMIHRRGFWDLPKGKVDIGESPETAGMREVNEETGVQDLMFLGFFAHTYHTYKEDEHDILKRTWWYEMSCERQALVPQADEDIEIAEWTAPDKVVERLPNAYPSIAELLQKLLEAKV